MRDWSKTLLSQFASSQVIVSLIASFDAAMDQSANIEAFLTYIWNVRTAVGYGLNVWGTIVGVNRVVPSPVPITLEDPDYQTLILVKAAANIGNVTVPTLNALLREIFSGSGLVYVQDNLDMTLSYVFLFQPSAAQQAIVQYSGALPRPAGVLVNYYWQQVYGPLNTVALNTWPLNSYGIVSTDPSPSLGVSPATGSVYDGVSTLSITATLANSSAGLTAALSGDGTISTTSPVSGTPFVYTPPSSGTGTATVTVSDATDSLSAHCTISYSPPPALSITPESGSVVVGGTPLSITATLANSSAALTATVIGGGTISTAYPTSGVVFTYTPPSSGSGVATVTVTDATDSLSVQCAPIDYAPPSDPGLLNSQPLNVTSFNSFSP